MIKSIFKYKSYFLLFLRIYILFLDSGSSNKSKSGSSNSPGSSGGPNKASNAKKTNVVNKDVSGAGVNHGNVQQKADI